MESATLRNTGEFLVAYSEADSNLNSNCHIKRKAEGRERRQRRGGVKATASIWTRKNFRSLYPLAQCHSKLIQLIYGQLSPGSRSPGFNGHNLNGHLALNRHKHFLWGIG